jgi:uncharacterized membrane protein
VRALPLAASINVFVQAECVSCHWAAGITVVAIVLGIIFLFSVVLTFLPERMHL